MYVCASLRAGRIGSGQQFNTPWFPASALGAPIMGNGVDSEGNVDVEILGGRGRGPRMSRHCAPMLFMTLRSNVNVDPALS